MFDKEDLIVSLQNNDVSNLTKILSSKSKWVFDIINSSDDDLPFLICVEHDSVDCIKLLLNHLNDSIHQKIITTDFLRNLLNRQYKYGLTLLHYAAELRSTECAQLLLDTGADPNISANDELLSYYNNTPMHIACLKGNLNMLKLLVRYGGKFDSNNNLFKVTPLYIAVSRNSFQCAEYLISLGANVMERTSDGDTPLHYAQLSEAGNHLECTKLLLEHGADVNAKNSDDETPLHLAAENCNDKAIEYLIAHGAEINGQSLRNGETPLHLAIPSIERPDYDYDYDHAWDAVKVLLNHHPRLDIKNYDQETPLKYAVSESTYDVVRLLIDYGADVKAMLDYYTNKDDRASILSYLFIKYKGEEEYYPDKYRHNFYDLLHDYLTEEERIPFEAVKRAKREP